MVFSDLGASPGGWPITLTNKDTIDRTVTGGRFITGTIAPRARKTIRAPRNPAGTTTAATSTST